MTKTPIRQASCIAMELRTTSIHCLIRHLPVCRSSAREVSTTPAGSSVRESTRTVCDGLFCLLPPPSHRRSSLRFWRFPQLQVCAGGYGSETVPPIHRVGRCHLRFEGRGCALPSHGHWRDCEQPN